MPVRILTPEEAAELRRELYGDPDGGSEMVISSSLARDMKRHFDRKKTEAETWSKAETGDGDPTGSAGTDTGADQ